MRRLGNVFVRDLGCDSIQISLQTELHWKVIHIFVWHSEEQLLAFWCDVRAIHMCFPRTHTHTHKPKPIRVSQFSMNRTQYIAKIVWMWCGTQSCAFSSVSPPLQHVASIYVLVQHRTSTTSALNIGIVHTHTQDATLIWPSIIYVAQQFQLRGSYIFMDCMYFVQHFIFFCVCVCTFDCECQFFICFPIVVWINLTIESSWKLCAFHVAKNLFNYKIFAL